MTSICGSSTGPGPSAANRRRREPIALLRLGRVCPGVFEGHEPSTQVAVHFVGDVVENLLQGPIDLDAFLDTHGGSASVLETAAMIPNGVEIMVAYEGDRCSIACLITSRRSVSQFVGDCSQAGLAGLDGRVL